MSGLAKVTRAAAPVAYLSRRENLRIQVNQVDSEVEDPTAARHPGLKMAEFNDGIFATDDLEIIEALDKRHDVWRADDPTAILKMELGPGEFERLQSAFTRVQDAQTREETSESIS